LKAVNVLCIIHSVYQLQGAKLPLKYTNAEKVSVIIINEYGTGSSFIYSHSATGIALRKND